MTGERRGVALRRATLRNYVKRLRQALGDGDRLRIITRADGYLICVADGELDLARFETLRDQAGELRDEQGRLAALDAGDPAASARAAFSWSYRHLSPDAARMFRLLGLASQIGNRYQQARAYDGLARACHAAGDPAQARQHWQQALALYTDLGVPEAGQVRARLDDPGRRAERPRRASSQGRNGRHSTTAAQISCAQEMTRKNTPYRAYWVKCPKMTVKWIAAAPADSEARPPRRYGLAVAGAARIPWSVNTGALIAAC